MWMKAKLQSIQLSALLSLIFILIVGENFLQWKIGCVGWNSSHMTVDVHEVDVTLDYLYS